MRSFLGVGRQQTLARLRRGQHVIIVVARIDADFTVIHVAIWVHTEFKSGGRAR